MSSPSPAPGDFRVFISYSRDDLPLVEPVVDLLRATRDMVFHDVDSIPPGEQWRPALERALTETHLLVVFWCRHAAESEFVRAEYDLGMERGKKVLPLLIDDTPLPDKLGAYQWIDFRKTIGPTHAAPPPPPLPEPQTRTAPLGPADTRLDGKDRVLGVAKWLLAAVAVFVLGGVLLRSIAITPAGLDAPTDGPSPWLIALVAAALLALALLLARTLRTVRIRSRFELDVGGLEEASVRRPTEEEQQRMAAKLADALERERTERLVI